MAERGVSGKSPSPLKFPSPLHLDHPFVHLMVPTWKGTHAECVACCMSSILRAAASKGRYDAQMAKSALDAGEMRAQLDKSMIDAGNMRAQLDKSELDSGVMKVEQSASSYA